MLQFKNVSLAINKTEILRNINFTITPGEKVALLGGSGAGKSSIFKLLIGETKPTSGSINLDNFSLNDLDLNSLQKYRRQIGVVFQDIRLLPGKTVWQNIAFALEVCGEDAKIPRKIPELLKLVGLEHRANAFPDTLSGGEKQRVAIARALVHNPKILIADEPTGNLDPKNSREIGNLFEKLNKEKDLTIFLSTHDIALVSELAPRIIRIEKGQVLFDEKKCPMEKAFKGIL
jgi:cell division transport system ATP-binding protein